MGFAKYQEDIVSRYVNDNYQGGDVVSGKSTDIKAPVTKKKNKREKTMELKELTIQKARPMPVIILADTSGSMSENGKIEALNDAIKDMVATFADESRRMAEIQVGLVTFGGDAKIHLPLAAAHEIKDLKLMKAEGWTPMGEALELVASLLEDKEAIPSRAYRPALVLLSDGHPTDEWQKGLRELCNSERAKKATRFAMAIGSDADESILKEFINDLEAPLFRAHQARDIHKFFRAITMSVTTRTRSQSPNDIPAIDFNDFLDDDDLELKF
jgi:uncharacterized protein YegL